MSDIKITITCPACETNFEKKARELADGCKISCPKCGESTVIRGGMFTEMQENLEKNKKKKP